MCYPFVLALGKASFDRRQSDRADEAFSPTNGQQAPLWMRIYTPPIFNLSMSEGFIAASSQLLVFHIRTSPGNAAPVKTVL